jgi:CheY-like chemotaxis protein
MKKVLVVEDDFILALVHRKYLEKLGCEILETVITGEQAIASALKNPPDFILMDIRIEGDMDGIDVMLEIQKQKNIPVIYVTGNSEPSVFERASQTNMKGFLVKPLHVEELKKIIDNL